MGETGIGREVMKLFTQPVATDSTEEIEMEEPRFEPSTFEHWFWRAIDKLT